MSSETVKPMPPSSARPMTSHQLSSSASRARVKRDTSQVAAVMPTVLPTTRATTIPRATESRSESVSPDRPPTATPARSEEHTSELQSRQYLVCRLLLEKKTHLHSPLPA